ncbi:MAG: hypothetical protein MUD10_00925 [Candidatus Pacebacteria bacterium]|jgi:hypothetical protein|nr:hypothetical protein [Candidatus Paceibacterota bacterium]
MEESDIKNAIKFMFWFEIAIVVAVAAYFFNLYLKPYLQSKACPAETKTCSDGSIVKRSGPNCEFAPCPSKASCQGESCPAKANPAAPSASAWRKYSDPAGFSFDYPAQLGKMYVVAVDWPPQLRFSQEVFSCLQTDNAMAAIVTRLVAAGGRNYCVTSESRPAAGGTNRSYAFSFPQSGRTAIFTFTLRFAQCADYAEPQRSACLAEQKSFDPAPTVNSMARTIKF